VFWVQALQREESLLRVYHGERREASRIGEKKNTKTLAGTAGCVMYPLTTEIEHDIVDPRWQRIKDS
jgi:hypothetical protein